MSNTVPQQKVVSKNGRSFVQTYHVNPNANVSSQKRDLSGIAPSVPNKGHNESHADLDHALALYKNRSYGNGREQDFVDGFNACYQNGFSDPGQALREDGNRDGNSAGYAGYFTGFRAALIAKLGQEQGNYFTNGVYLKTDVYSGGLSQSDSELYKNKVLPYNPFVAGDEVFIPAGTPYETSDPSKPGIQYSKRGQRVKLYSSDQGYADVALGRCEIGMPMITAVGSSSYYKDYVVTPDVILANDHELRPGDLRDAEETLRGTI